MDAYLPRSQSSASATKLDEAPRATSVVNEAILSSPLDIFTQTQLADIPHLPSFDVRLLRPL
jgi:hypothetical protein